MGIPVWPPNGTHGSRDNISRNGLESLIGALVLTVALCFGMFSYSNSDIQKVAGYAIRAKLSSAGSLTERADVQSTGVKVGSVLGLNIDPATFLSDVRMAIDG